MVDRQLAARNELSNAARGTIRTQLLLAQADLVGFVGRLAAVERGRTEAPLSPQEEALHSAAVAVALASALIEGVPEAWRRFALSVATSDQAVLNEDWWTLAADRAVRTDLNLVRRCANVKSGSFVQLDWSIALDALTRGAILRKWPGDPPKTIRLARPLTNVIDGGGIFTAALAVFAKTGDSIAPSELKPFDDFTRALVNWMPGHPSDFPAMRIAAVQAVEIVDVAQAGLTIKDIAVAESVVGLGTALNPPRGQRALIEQRRNGDVISRLQLVRTEDGTFAALTSQQPSGADDYMSALLRLVDTQAYVGQFASDTRDEKLERALATLSGAAVGAYGDLVGGARKAAAMTRSLRLQGHRTLARQLAYVATSPSALGMDGDYTSIGVLDRSAAAAGLIGLLISHLTSVPRRDQAAVRAVVRTYIDNDVLASCARLNGDMYNWANRKMDHMIEDDTRDLVQLVTILGREIESMRDQHVDLVPRILDAAAIASAKLQFAHPKELRRRNWACWAALIDAVGMGTHPRARFCYDCVQIVETDNRTIRTGGEYFSFCSDDCLRRCVSSPMCPS